MCLVTERKRANIAKEDMTVYKLVFASQNNPKLFYSEIKKFPYALGKLEETELSKSNKGLYYSMEEVNYYLKRECIFWQQGFHSFTDIETAKKADSESELTLVKCRVPKGSRYVNNLFGMMISDKIIVKEVVTAS